jgi:hypothetical protein
MLVIQFIIGLIIGFAIFLGGMYFYARNSSIGKSSSQCPNILIQYGAKYYLLNSKLKRVAGVNPLEFNTLEDYNDFLKWQHAVGIKCPVLYVQKTYDAQGKKVFKIRPNPTETKGGLPPSPPEYIKTNNPDTTTINTTTVSVNEPVPSSTTCGNSSPQVPGHSPTIMTQLWSYISDIPTKWTGEMTMAEEHNNYVNKIEYPAELLPCPKTTPNTLSDDPMDVNWGGEDFTEKAVKSGKYAGSELSR